MAINLLVAVLDRGPDNLSEMAVLLALADGADRDTGETWPSHRTIARRARQSARSVRNVLARLEAAGWVTWERRVRANGSHASNVYTLNLAKLGETPRNGVPTPRNGVPTPRNDVPTPPEPGAYHAPERGAALEPSKKETRRAVRQSDREASQHRRSPHESGGGAVSLELVELGQFQRAMLRQGRDMVTGDGRTMKAGSAEHKRLAAALAESDAQMLRKGAA